MIKKIYHLPFTVYHLWICILACMFAFACKKENAPLSENLDWVHYRANSALSGYTERELPQNPKLLWSYKSLQRTNSSPVVYDGIVYWSTKRGRIYGVNATGDTCFVYNFNTAVESVPFIHDSILYIGRIDGIMSALSLTNGEIVWDYETGGQLIGAANAADGKLIFGSYDHNLYILDIVSGKEIARCGSRNYINGTVAIWNNFVLFGGCDGWLRKVHIALNTMVDSVELKSYIPASPAIEGNAAYVADFTGNLYEFDLSKNKLSPQLLISSTDDNEQFTSMPAVSKSKVYCLSSDGYLRAIDRKTRKEAWNYLLRGDAGESAPLICKDKIIVCAKSGQIAILDAATEKLLWEYDAGEQIVSTPAVVAGRFYVLTAKGTLLCFGLEK